MSSHLCWPWVSRRGAERTFERVLEIARKTNGSYYYAADHENLTDIFRDIFFNLPAVLTG